MEYIRFLCKSTNTVDVQPKTNIFQSRIDKVLDIFEKYVKVNPKRSMEVRVSSALLDSEELYLRPNFNLTRGQRCIVTRYIMLKNGWPHSYESISTQLKILNTLVATLTNSVPIDTTFPIEIQTSTHFDIFPTTDYYIRIEQLIYKYDITIPNSVSNFVKVIEDYYLVFTSKGVDLDTLFVKSDKVAGRYTEFKLVTPSLKQIAWKSYKDSLQSTGSVLDHEMKKRF